MTTVSASSGSNRKSGAKNTKGTAGSKQTCGTLRFSCMLFDAAAVLCRRDTHLPPEIGNKVRIVPEACRKASLCHAAAAAEICFCADHAA